MVHKLVLAVVLWFKNLIVGSPFRCLKIHGILTLAGILQVQVQRGRLHLTQYKMKEEQKHDGL